MTAPDTSTGGYETDADWAAAMLTGRLDPAGPLDPFPVCWARISDEALPTEAANLADWVEWVAARYGLDHRTVPGCWPRHGPLVEELSALRTAWIVAYRSTSDGDAPLAWHAAFAAARDRLADWTARTGCRPGQHRISSPDGIGAVVPQ